MTEADDDFKVEIIPGISTEPSPAKSPAIKTLDKEFNRILQQRESEKPAVPDVPDHELKEAHEYVINHPDEFSPNLSTDEKIELRLSFLKRIEQKKAGALMDKQAGFKALDRAVEDTTTAIQNAETEAALKQAATKIYEGGTFVQYCRTAFDKSWYGDQHVIDAILLQAAALNITNVSSGINLHISGKTQSGKSDAVRHALKFLPDTLKYSGTFSRLALYHSKKFHDGMIVFSDDTSFDPETAAILRGILTAWEDGTERETLVGKEWVTVKVPKRLNMILTSVESVSKETDDAQDESRFLTLEISRDPEAERAIRKFMQTPTPDISNNLAIIRAVWTQIPKTDVALHDTIEKGLPFREFSRYLTMIKAAALLNNRTRTTKDDIQFVDMLLERSRPMISSDIAGLTKNERAVMEYLKSGVEVRTIKDIQAELGMTLNSVYRALRGRVGTFQNPTNGLLMKDRHITTVWLDGVKEWGVQYAK